MIKPLSFSYTAKLWFSSHCIHQRYVISLLTSYKLCMGYIRFKAAFNAIFKVFDVTFFYFNDANLITFFPGTSVHKCVKRCHIDNYLFLLESSVTWWKSVLSRTLNCFLDKLNLISMEIKRLKVFTLFNLPCDCLF